MIKIRNIFRYLPIVALVGCAGPRNNHTNFTNELRRNLEVRNIDLSKLQYFLDQDIVLKREISSDTAKILKGRAYFENGKLYETIVLRKYTPGVCTAVYPNRLQVSFDTDDSKFLTFSNPTNSMYQLVNTHIVDNNPYILTYDEKKYTVSVKNANPNLLISKTVVYLENNIQKKMQGRKINK